MVEVLYCSTSHNIKVNGRGNETKRRRKTHQPDSVMAMKSNLFSKLLSTFQGPPPLTEEQQRARELFKAVQSPSHGPDEFQEQIDGMKKVLELDPNHITALRLLVEAFRDSRDYPSLIEYGERALALCPDLGMTRAYIIDAYKHERRYSEAIMHCREEIRQDPEACGAYSTLGEILSPSGDHKQAAKSFEHAVIARRASHHTNDLTFLLQLARELAIMGQWARVNTILADLAIRYPSVGA